MEHWSTLSKGIKFDLNRNSYPGSSLNQKGVEVLDTTDEEGTGRLATGGGGELYPRKRRDRQGASPSPSQIASLSIGVPADHRDQLARTS